MKCLTLVCKILSCAVLLTGCNGGGGQGDQNNVVLRSPVGIGYAVYSTATEVRVVTLATGVSKILELNYTVWPSQDGQEWLAIDTTNRYRNREDDFIWFDQNGSRTNRLTIRKSLHGIPKLSPNKQTIGVFWADEDSGESYTRPMFTLFDRQANVANRIDGVSSFDWLPDGNLVYTTKTGDVFWANMSGIGRRLIKRFAGEMQDIAASRDGKRLAMSVRRQQDPEWRVWTMDIDGNNLRQLTTSRANEMDPVWMGNTGWLLVRQGVRTSALGYAGCPRLHMVNSNAPNVVELASDDSEHARVVKYRDLDSGRDYFTDVCPFSPAAWIQE